MRRITIRNLKSPRAVKPHVFDVLVDENEVYFEVKARNNKNEIIALTDVMVQITPSAVRSRTHRRKKPGTP